jgi:DNA-binding NarL/FixJ family response regulator
MSSSASPSGEEAAPPGRREGSAADGPVELSELSERERQIAVLLVQGMTNKEIAERLFVSTETIKSYVARILRKLGARNRVQAAVLLARDDSFASPPPE